MDALIADRGSARYGDEDVKRLNELLLCLSTQRERCVCCDKRVCWHRIASLEKARQFAVSHIPHKDESPAVLLSWRKLVSLAIVENR